ncbi:hypothetical protein BTZ20_0444 [Rhodococcus sp. MTM3W5.2]|nr:hypothetical protein BTZ20_0444 [Rhodococcus sp. MTM3W5.2]
MTADRPTPARPVTSIRTGARYRRTARLTRAPAAGSASVADRRNPSTVASNSIDAIAPPPKKRTRPPARPE